MAEAWLVRYTHYGEPQKFITLDRVRADEYAIQRHGIVYPLVVCQDPQSQPLFTIKEAACSRVV